MVREDVARLIDHILSCKDILTASEVTIDYSDWLGKCEDCSCDKAKLKQH